MSTLLYIQASPRAERSYSRAVADALVEAYGQAHPDDRVVTRDLFRMELPAFDGAALEAKYAILHGQDPSSDQQKAWAGVEAVINEFKSADRLVFAVPMWNFGVPYRLKQYMDVIIQPGYTFSFSPESGYTGLVKDRPAVVVYARGGEYAEGTDMAAYDLQKPTVDGLLRFIGFEDIRSIVVEPTLAGGPDTAAARKAAAVTEAEEIAATL